MVDFIQSDQAGIIIVTNKAAALLDLWTIKQYIKSTNHIEVDNIEVPCLPQSKLYLKIIDIPYLLENTNTLIMADVDNQEQPHFQQYCYCF